MPPVPHTEHLAISFPPDDDTEVSDNDPDFPNSAAEENYDFEPHKFPQVNLNDLVRDPYLSKDKAELLVSSLNEKNLLKQGVREMRFSKTVFL